MKQKTIELNKERIEAKNTKEGNLLIIASAGTGKTTTIVERYVNLVENHGLKPSEIMMTTFTNKAAKDMIEKINQRTTKQPSCIGTMHSLFIRMLRDNADKIGLNPNFTLLTEESDKKKIIKRILEERRINFKSGDILYLMSRISRFKNAGISHETLDENINLNEQTGEVREEIEGETILVSSKIKKQAISAYKDYQKFLKLSNTLDFDDILLFTFELLSKNKEIRDNYSKQFKAIMVDEAQDLNVVQVKILDLLENNNLCLIGDDCQNIYTWRGSSNDLIFKFDKKHKKIIEAVNKIISSLSFKIDKKLICTRTNGESIRTRDFASFDEEIDFLVSE